jgi:hypothetical protein
MRRDEGGRGRGDSPGIFRGLTTQTSGADPHRARSRRSSQKYARESVPCKPLLGAGPAAIIPTHLFFLRCRRGPPRGTPAAAPISLGFGPGVERSACEPLHSHTCPLWQPQANIRASEVSRSASEIRGLLGSMPAVRPDARRHDVSGLQGRTEYDPDANRRKLTG